MRGPAGERQTAAMQQSGLDLLLQIQELRDRSNLEGAGERGKDGRRKASPRSSPNKSAVVEDDLRWLLDKEEGGSLSAKGAEALKEELSAVEEWVSNVRIQYGTIHNLTLRREDKLRALEEELRLQRAEAADTPAEKQQAADNIARHASVGERVTSMEQAADEMEEYTLTLNMLIKRLHEAKGGHEARVASYATWTCASGGRWRRTGAWRTRHGRRRTAPSLSASSETTCARPMRCCRARGSESTSR